MIRPGEIYVADIEGAGPHPVVVMSRELFNRGLAVLVVPCTSARFAYRSGLPNCVPFRAGEFGLWADCVAQRENLAQIEITRLDTDSGPIGELDDLALRDVIRAVGYVIESDCEPL